MIYTLGIVVFFAVLVMLVAIMIQINAIEKKSVDLQKTLAKHFESAKNSGM
jgi:Na+-transporting methylmalonyl-CoA/oxaloacetate decarboxylase gamma subunit